MHFSSTARSMLISLLRRPSRKHGTRQHRAKILPRCNKLDNSMTVRKAYSTRNRFSAAQPSASAPSIKLSPKRRATGMLRAQVATTVLAEASARPRDRAQDYLRRRSRAVVHQRFRPIAQCGLRACGCADFMRSSHRRVPGNGGALRPSHDPLPCQRR